MARYGLGQPIRLTNTVTDLSGTLVNPTTITLTVKKPDATTQVYASPTNDSTGVYHQDLPTTDLTQLGHYQYVWTSTGTGAAVSPPAGFDVFDPFEVTVLSLQDAKEAVNIPAATTTSDAEILRMIATIEASLENMTGGPIVTRTVSNERVTLTSGYRTFVLRCRPLVSITSIVDIASGVAMSLADLDPDYVSGIIRRKLGLSFASRGPNFLVTYTAGFGTAVPPAFAEAAAIILRHLWETQRAGGVTVPGMGGEEMVSMPGWGYAIPNRAAELLAPYVYQVFV